MRHDIFSTPVWVEKIEPDKIELTSKNFEKKFLSGSLSTLDTTMKNNKITDEGVKYLLDIILKNLSELGVTKISLSNIWRNKYQDDFQDKHFHAGCHFCFVVYEKLKKPQTVFFHPAFDLLSEKKLEEVITSNICPNLEENDIIIFPAYLKHMVKKCRDSITISGNINII
tara:strand:- start:981 stop:1490 length:510 start_codon:yes stop_codon:yes gene_type:complete